jgi:glycosyltransferase involved in cell wall biosynthesis
VCRADSPLGQRTLANGFEIAPLGRGAITSLRRRLASERFDIVHAHDARAQNIAVLASAGLPLRRAVSRQVAFEPRHGLIHRWKYGKTAHGIIANSESVRRVLISSGVPAGLIEVIHPGIELPAELPGPSPRAEARARWGLAKDHFVIGHAGAFTQEKGQDIALEAALLLAAKFPHVRMVLAGDGPERTNPRMIELAERAENVARLPGFLDDLSELYAALDLFIMPSRSEAWGLAPLHAMANGLAVIASDIEGLRELVEPGKTGWLVAPDSPGALADAIEAAIANPLLRAEYGRKGSERAAQFSIRRTVEQTERFYEGLLAGVRASQTAT